MTLTFRNARTTIENAIIDKLAEAYAVRLPTVATIAALRAFPARALPNQRPTLIFVTSSGYAFRWRPWSTSADDGATIIKPDDITSTPGRWVRTTSTSASGYLQACDLFNDDDGSEAVIEQRIYGTKPAMLMTWQNTRRAPKSHRAGALYWARMSFKILVISEQLRGEQMARQGSGNATEAAADPGTGAMLGDVKELLAGMTGEELGVTDVATIEIGDEEPVLKDLERRSFVEAIDIEVRYTEVKTADTDAVSLDDPWEFNTQRQLAQTSGETFDGESYVTGGLTVPVGASLTQTIAAGTAYIGGSAVAVGATAHTFTASRVTYRDLLSNGTWEFHEAYVGEDAPDASAGALRVGVTVTDANGVISDAVIADSLIDFEGPDKVDLTELVSLAVTPTPTTASVAGTRQFTAIGTFSDGTTADLTEGATWASSNTGVASVNAAGTALGVAPGTCSITATIDDIASNAASLTVS